jgi:hypothetical protein
LVHYELPQVVPARFFHFLLETKFLVLVDSESDIDIAFQLLRHFQFLPNEKSARNL